MFYAQSTGAVISGRYTSHIVYLTLNNVHVPKWVHIQPRNQNQKQNKKAAKQMHQSTYHKKGMFQPTKQTDSGPSFRKSNGSAVPEILSNKHPATKPSSIVCLALFVVNFVFMFKTPDSERRHKHSSTSQSQAPR